MRVYNNNDYGFTLNLDTDQPDLVNSDDSTYRIDSVTGYYKYLAANQWGYGIGNDATSFSPVSNATLADVTKDNNGYCYNISDCTINLTFGAKIDPKHLPVGNYSTTLTYTATSKPKPYVPPTPTPTPPAPAPYVPPEPPKPKWTTNGCAHYGSNDNCMLTYDIPSYGRLTSYDYERGRWALARITLRGNYSMAYVPRFAQSGYYIRFCRDSYSSGCTDNDVDPAFTGRKLGKWISLKTYGCTNVGEAFGYDDWWAPEYSAARILAEAFGSPCP